MKKPADPKRQAELLAEVRRSREERETSYRGRALRLYPNICASCGREFAGKKLRELTVHHKDHDHENNPPDGSNWELLCLYCHDHEHEKHKMAGHSGGSQGDQFSPSVFKPFEGLDSLLVDPSDEP